MKTKHILGGLGIAVLLAMSFQNCSQMSTDVAGLAEMASTDLTTLEGSPTETGTALSSSLNLQINQPQVCEKKGSLKFTISYRPNSNYQCFDYTKQSLNQRGPLCQSGPEIAGINPVQTAQSCLKNFTICGVQPTAVVLKENTASATKIEYTYGNLPPGCSGNLSIFESQGNGSLALHQKIDINIASGSCKKCSNGTTTCGTCPSTNSGGGSGTSTSGNSNSTEAPSQNAQACQAGATRTCSMENGQGVQTCNAQGTHWNVCVPSQCNSGYIKDIYTASCRLATCLDYMDQPSFKPATLSLVHTGKIYGDYAPARHSNLVLTGTGASTIASLPNISRQDYVDGQLAISSNPIFDPFESSKTNLRFKATHVSQQAQSKPQGSSYKIRYMCGQHLVAEASTTTPVMHAATCASAAPDDDAHRSPRSDSALGALSTSVQSAKVIYDTVSYFCNGSWNADGKVFEFATQKQGASFTYDSTPLLNLGAHCSGTVEVKGNMTAIFLSSSGQLACMSDRATKNFKFSK